MTYLKKLDGQDLSREALNKDEYNFGSEFECFMHWHITTSPLTHLYLGSENLFLSNQIQCLDESFFAR